MKESSTYQEIVKEGFQQGIEKGRAAEARAYLRRRALRVLGEPDAAALQALEAATDPVQLEELTNRVLDGRADSWASLLGLSEPKG